MRWMIGLVLVLLGACRKESSPGSQIVSERMALGSTEGDATLPFSASCSETGASGCASGLCVRTPNAAIGEGWICSQSCADDTPCPTGARCEKILPDPDGFLCIPEVAP